MPYDTNLSSLTASVLPWNSRPCSSCARSPARASGRDHTRMQSDTQPAFARLALLLTVETQASRGNP